MNKLLIIIFLCFVGCPVSAQDNAVYERSQIFQLFQNQDFENALNQLVTLQKPAMPTQFHLDLGYAYFMMDRLDEAQAEYLRSFKADSTSIQANLYLANIYLRQRLEELALVHYKRLTHLYPDVYRYWQYAASAAGMLKEYDSAHAYIEKSYTLNPRSASVANEYARSLQLKKMSDQAEKVIDDFLKTDSSGELIITRKIDISFKKNNNEDVIYWGERLWHSNAVTSNAFTQLLFSYLNTNRPHKCIELFDWMESNNMSNESAAYGAALAYTKKKEFKKSNELLTRCIENNIIKEAATYLRAKADNFEGLKQYDKSIAYYDTSYYIFQKPIDLYYAGAVYDGKLNDRSGAGKYYKKYLQKAGKPTSSDEKRVNAYITTFLKPKSGP